MDDYFDEYDDVEYETYEEDETLDNSPFGPETSAKTVYEHCMEPTILSFWDQVIWLMLACLIFRIGTQLVKVPNPLGHLFSIICGLFGLFSIVGPNAMYTCILIAASYFCLVACHKRSLADNTYGIIMGSLLIYLVGREHLDILGESWEQVRGVQMIIVMKTLSVSYELWNRSRNELPSILGYLGYVLCPATLMFGPWISYSTYISVCEGSHRHWGFRWGVKVIATALVSILCLTFSACWVYWIFAGLNLSWIIAMRDAMSFRFSHYFVCYMSVATATLSGFYSPSPPSEDNLSTETEVTNPWKIEIPRSLVEVVIHWNISMHRWLKHHVFRPARPYGPFKSVLLTFLVSSMLHGMNFNLTMVLLSLGFYTYVEYTLREKLASIFDACIRSRKCPSSPMCQHSLKSTHPGVMAVNFLFVLWSIFHLAYLGIMMDKSHLEENDDILSSQSFLDDTLKYLKRWSDLDYTSHLIVFVVFLGNLAI